MISWVKGVCLTLHSTLTSTHLAFTYFGKHVAFCCVSETESDADVFMLLCAPV